MHAYNMQTMIGWDKFVCGKLSVHWETLSRPLFNNDISKLERWAIQLISLIWNNGVLQVWDLWNKDKYGEGPEHHQSKKLKEKLLQEAQLLLEQSDQYWQWVQKTLTELEQYSVIGLKAWIRNARLIEWLYDQERCNQGFQQPDHNMRHQKQSKGQIIIGDFQCVGKSVINLCGT